MQTRLVVSLFVVLMSSFSWASSRLIDTAVSADQGVFRLEMHFDQGIASEQVGLQFEGNELLLNIPNATLKKVPEGLKAGVDYIKDIQIKSQAGKRLTVSLEFNELTAMQLKENLSLESAENLLILEVLPPLINKGPSENLLNTGNGIANPQSADGLKMGTEMGSVVAGSEALPPKETEIPVFSQKKSAAADDSGAGKIIFMVISVIAMGGGLVWWLRNQSKMVNGPESLMKIKMVTQFHLGPKKSLAVIRIAGESLLLGITENDIRLIKTLSLLDEDLPEVAGDSFGQILKKGSTENQSLLTEDPEEVRDEGTGTDEDFSFGPAVKTTLTQKIPLLRKMI